MAEFGSTSLRRIRSCHTVLETLFTRIVAKRDIAIAEGERDEAKQNLYFAKELSKVKYPDSKHNSSPSMAADVCPYPEMWDSIPAFKEIRALVLAEWKLMEKEGLTGGYDLRHGADWDSDGDTTDQTFMDWPHWELVKP